MTTVADLAARYVAAREERNRLRKERDGLDCDGSSHLNPISLGGDLACWKRFTWDYDPSERLRISDDDMCASCVRIRALHVAAIAAGRRAAGLYGALRRAVLREARP